MLAIQICPRAATGKVLPLSEKMKVLDLIRKEKTSYAEAAKICGKNEASVKCCELGKKGKKLYKF